MAVCSSAQRVLIYDRDETSEEEWILSDVIENAHDAPIWRVDWAPPEFGQVIATCSEDRFLFIWNERGVDGTINKGGAVNQGTRISKWKRVARLQDAKAALTDVCFAPSTMSLRVGVCSADGTVSIYESDGVDLSLWNLEDTFICHPGPNGNNPHSTSGQFQLGKGIRGCSALSWSRASWLRALVVAGCDGTLQLWVKPTSWKLAAQVLAHDGCTRDVAWCPNFSREHELVATCGDDGKAIIWSIDVSGETASALEEATISKVAEFHCEPGPTWRVSWNLTGTTLAVGADDGSVLMWRQDEDGNWVPQARISVNDNE